MTPPLLEARSISKAFPGTQALSDVTFDLLPGEIHALVGENGAGKSTLMNILSGVLLPDSGQIYVQGQAVEMVNPRRAQELGIGMVFQELSLVPSLSVAENVFPNRAPTRGPGLVDWATLYRRTEDLTAAFEVRVDPRTPVRELGVSTRQIVEIAKALSLKARILLLDEPTSALSPDEVAVLFRIVRRLKDSQLGIVFISHRVREVFAIGDRITVLRDGRRVGTYDAGQLTPDGLVRLMVGRELKETLPGRGGPVGGELMHVAGLSHAKHFRDVSFHLRQGEILGLAGLKGSGRTELARALAGAVRVDAGEIWIDGKRVAIRSPADAVALGIGFLPEDRKHDGLFLAMSLRDNVAAADLRQFTRWGILDPGREDAMAQGLVERLRIRTPSLRQIVGRLSGGNQQKVMLSKWLVTRPRILIVDEPTHGVDVGAKAEIHALLRELAGQGVAILLISSELPEILGLSDRVLVMHEGSVVGELRAAEATEEGIMALAAGHTAQTTLEAV